MPAATQATVVQFYTKSMASRRQMPVFGLEHEGVRHGGRTCRSSKCNGLAQTGVYDERDSRGGGRAARAPRKYPKPNSQPHMRTRGGVGMLLAAFPRATGWAIVHWQVARGLGRPGRRTGTRLQQRSSARWSAQWALRPGHRRGETETGIIMKLAAAAAAAGASAR